MLRPNEVSGERGIVLENKRKGRFELWNDGLEEDRFV